MYRSYLVFDEALNKGFSYSTAYAFAIAYLIGEGYPEKGARQIASEGLSTYGRTI